MILKCILNKAKIQRLSLIVVSLLTFMLGIDHYPSESAPFETRDNLVSSLTKLDFDKVDFWLDADPEFRKMLSVLAIEKLTAAGLYTKGHRRSPPSERVAFLQLTLRSYPITDDKAGKVMYRRMLELWETVIPERNPELKIDSVTWS